MSVHSNHYPAPSAHIHAQGFRNPNQLAPHEFQHASYPYSAQNNNAYAISTPDTKRGATYPAIADSYRKNGGSLSYDDYYPATGSSPESLYSISSTSSDNLGGIVSGVDQEVDNSRDLHNRYQPVHAATNTDPQDPNRYYIEQGAHYDNGYFDGSAPSEQYWGLSDHCPSVVYTDTGYYYLNSSPSSPQLVDAYHSPAPHYDGFRPPMDSHSDQVDGEQDEDEYRHQLHSRIYAHSLPYPDSVYAHTSQAQTSTFIPQEHLADHLDHLHVSDIGSSVSMERVYHSTPSQHQPVPINSRSTYSELSANVAFIAATTSSPPKSQSPPSLPIRSESHASASFQAPQSWPRPSQIQPQPVVNHGSPPARVPEHVNVTMTTAAPTRESSPRRQGFMQLLPRSEPESSRSTMKLSALKKGPEKKQTLACLFCRERKIACGRPAEGSDDHTCNQCARRQFKCEYPTESRRGQHKRSRKKTHDVNDAN